MSPWLKLRLALKGWGQPMPADVRCVWGHFLARKYDRLHPDWATAIWFRDPVERTAAQYYLWKETPHPSNPAYRAMVRKNLTLEEFAGLPLMRNVYTRILDGRCVPDLNFIGIFEDYERSLALFRKVFRIESWPDVAPDLEVTPVEYGDMTGWRARTLVPDASVRARIEQLNAQDMSLYRRAKTHFEEACYANGLSPGHSRGFRAPEGNHRPLIFVHVPKTGGTSFAHALSQTYGTRFVRTDGDDPWTPLDANVDCIAGHFAIGRFKSRFPNARYSAWFRDPVERVVSAYEHWSRDAFPDQPLWREFKASKMSLVEYAGWAPVRNLQHRLMLHFPVEHLFYVGITEQFDRSMKLFAEMEGIPVPAQAELLVNPSKAVGTRYSIGELERRAILSLNALDGRIYERARLRFEALCTQAGM
jgi:hypothetical protein